MWISFDNYTEFSGTSEEVHRTFLKMRIICSSAEMCDKYFIIIVENGDVDFTTSEYEAAGCHGAVSSHNAVNIVCKN